MKSSLFYIFNHSSNFFLYVFTRKSFRRLLEQKSVKFMRQICLWDKKVFAWKSSIRQIWLWDKKVYAWKSSMSQIYLWDKKDKILLLIKSQWVIFYKCENKRWRLTIHDNTTQPLDDNNYIDYESFWETAALNSSILTKPNEKSSIKMVKDEWTAILKKN